MAASLLRQQPSLQLSSKHASVGDLPHLQGEGIPERPLLGGIETGLVDGVLVVENLWLRLFGMKHLLALEKRVG